VNPQGIPTPNPKTAPTINIAALTFVVKINNSANPIQIIKTPKVIRPMVKSPNNSFLFSAITLVV
jgi:hypothetical protein